MESPQIYIEWNDALAKHFFSPENIGQPIYLSVDDELIGRLGDVEMFIWAVKRGPPLISKSDSLCDKAYQLYQDWKKSKSKYEYPPYVAYLCLFVLAASREDERFAKHAYYPKLRNLIGEALEGGALHHFYDMFELWDDLEHWANLEKKGELGLFEARVVGSWFHVGIPIAQVILSPSERASLPIIFSRSGLDPASSPSDIQLASLVCNNDDGLLRNRTKRILQNPELDESAYEILLQTLRDELENWDGSIEEPDESVAITRKKTIGGLRLCLKLDGIASIAATSLRCRLNNRESPDDKLEFRSKNTGEILIAFEDTLGWSSELSLDTTGGVMDASLLRWTESFEIEEERLGWRFRTSTDPVRIFKSAVSEGLRGLVEVQSIPQNEMFYIACHANAHRTVEDWLLKDCKGMKQIPLTRGLPLGWKFFEVGSVVTVERISKVYPNLSFSQALRIVFRGGVHSSYGNNYFAFCPPLIELEGCSGNELVSCNGIELKPAPSVSSKYILPDNLPVDQMLKIEVRKDGNGGDPIARRSFTLTWHFDLEPYSETVMAVDRFGSSMPRPNNISDFVSGALVNSNLIADYSYPIAPESFRAESVVLLGAEPGQIVTWPKENITNEWKPIWAIAVSRKHGTATFCGLELVEPLNTGNANRSSTELKGWKEYLWHWRKRITSPRLPKLQRLWRRYIDVAKNV
jgi:hypothetical protein